VRASGRLLGAAIALSASLGEAVAREPDTRPVFTFVTENDLYARHNTDRHYSNGLRASWLSSEGWVRDRIWEWSTALPLPLLDYSARRRLGWAIGHNLYTPEDKTRLDPNPVDRPYAAWLYGGIALQSVTERWRREAPDRSDRIQRQDTVEVDLGVVGPAAQGEPVQNGWHRYATGSPQVRGWSSQLRNEPGIALVMERKWQFLEEFPKWGSLGVDAIPHISGSLGNVFTYAGAGATFRLGENLDVDFGPPRIRPALPGSGSFEPKDPFAWYVFLGGELRAVGRDIFLDGNTFTDSRSVAKKPFVADLQFGAALIFERARLSYTQVLRSREFDGQRRPDFFGSFGLSIRF
jgi:lipid A 3-O-deacylase